MSKSDQPRATFNALVLSLATTAAVHFGDMAEPGGGDVRQVNLEGAQQMIDLLTLLKDKTRGNLSSDEVRFLDEVLYELRFRYVEASRHMSQAKGRS